MKMTCEVCKMNSTYRDEVTQYDCNGFELGDNQDDVAATLCTTCVEDYKF